MQFFVIDASGPCYMTVFAKYHPQKILIPDCCLRNKALFAKTSYGPVTDDTDTILLLDLSWARTIDSSTTALAKRGVPPTNIVNIVAYVLRCLKANSRKLTQRVFFHVTAVRLMCSPVPSTGVRACKFESYCLSDILQ